MNPNQVQELLLQSLEHERGGVKIEDRLGTLEGGKIADIVAVDGNPLEDIRCMHRVVFVMKEGVVYKNR